MNDSLHRLLLLAASAGISMQDMNSALDEIRSSYPGDIEERYRHLRNRIRDLSHGYEGRTSNRTEDTPKIASPLDDVVKFIRNSGLRSNDAVERITDELSSVYGIHADMVPKLGDKEGIARWVSKAANSVGAARLINAAVGALSRPSGGGDNWRLSNR